MKHIGWHTVVGLHYDEESGEAKEVEIKLEEYNTEWCGITITEIESGRVLRVTITDDQAEEITTFLQRRFNLS